MGQGYSETNTDYFGSGGWPKVRVSTRITVGVSSRSVTYVIWRVAAGTDPLKIVKVSSGGIEQLVTATQIAYNDLGFQLIQIDGNVSGTVPVSSTTFTDDAVNPPSTTTGNPSGVAEGYVGLSNPTSVSATFNIWQDGNIIDTVTVPPGGTWAGYIKGDTGSPISYTVGGTGATVDSATGSIVYTGDPLDTWAVSGGALVLTGTTGTTSVSGPTQKPPEGVGGSGGTVWTAPNSGGGLAADTYREGVNKIIAAVAAGGGSGGGGGADVGTHTRLDQANEHLDRLGDHADRAATEGDAAEARLDNLQGQSGQVATAGQQAGNQGKEAALEALGEFGTPGAGGSHDPGALPSGAGVFTLNLHDGTGSREINLNPFSGDGLVAKAAAFIRRLIAWGLVVVFFIWVLRRVQQMMAAPFSTAPFGNSLGESINSVRVLGSGGGFGYAARLAALAVLLPVLLTLPMATIAAITAGLPWADLTGIYAGGPDSSAVAAGAGLGVSLQMANAVVPWALLMAEPLWYLAVEYVLFPSQFFWSMFIKFLPV